MEHLVLPGEVIRTRLEYCNCEDYEEMILAFLSDKLGYDYDYLDAHIKVGVKPGDNNKLIILSGTESVLYDIMNELSQLGEVPISRYPDLVYTYDLLDKRPDKESHSEGYEFVNGEYKW